MEVAAADAFRARIIVSMETMNSSGSWSAAKSARHDVITVDAPVEDATIVCVADVIRRLRVWTSCELILKITHLRRIKYNIVIIILTRHRSPLTSENNKKTSKINPENYEKFNHD